MKVCVKCLERFDSSRWTCPKCASCPESKDGFISFAPHLADENGGFSPHYFSQLSDVELNHFWFEGRNELIQWALRRYFPAAQTFLEVGCGTGFVLAGIRCRYPAIRATGVDLFTEGLFFAQSRIPGTELLQMDARHMPFESEFDVIGAFDTVEHIEEDELVLAEFFRSCRPGGGIMLTVPQHPFLWSAADEYAFHKRRYSKQELIAKVQRAGFRVVRTTSFVSLLLPLMLISRRRRQHLEAKFDALKEFRLASFTNHTLGWVLGVEKRLIQAGVSFPAGGSLLVVAQRMSSPG